ncbi:MAG: cytochrome c peroxidase, partial [Planctomycetota bacterium]
MLRTPAVRFSEMGGDAMRCGPRGFVGGLFLVCLAAVTALGATPQPPPTTVSLGKLLFFDPRLSGDATISCATCHDPQQAFTDGRAFSRGYPGSEYFRNTPTIVNAGQLPLFYWDARMSGDDMPSMIRDHIAESHFMQADGRLVIERLKQVPVYADQFQAVFGGEPTYGRILNALTVFVQSIESGTSPADRYAAGDKQALSPAAARGHALFHGKAGCVDCHQGPLYTDGQVHDLGLKAAPDLFRVPEREVTFRRFFRTLGIADYAQLRQDIGHACVTKSSQDRGQFRTAPLREVADTAPYMHDGRFDTLAAVVAFYNRGTDEALRPLQLSPAEQQDLVAFLHALSSERPEVNPPELPAYEPMALPTEPDEVAHAALPAADVDRRQFPALAALPSVPVPVDNPITEAKVELGQLLFFDDRLSGDVGTSCASCHDPRLGWGDGNALSRGYAGTQHWRNSQTVVNVGYLAKLFWAGESTSLESQAHSAITGNVAGNGDPSMIEERLAQIPEYVRRFQEAFGVETPTYELALRAIATFERAALVSKDSPVDEYLAGDTQALSEGALRGLALFEGKANCIRCHNGPLLSDESYHHLDLPQNRLFSRDPMRQITLRFQHFTRGVAEPVYRDAHTDLGLYYTTKRDADRGKFRTPPLRYLEYTAPYMHNGVFEDLEEVIDFYDAGGGEDPKQSRWLEPLGLTEDEKFDLLEFLESLSGDEIRVRTPELPPYAASVRTSDAAT